MHAFHEPYVPVMGTTRIPLSKRGNQVTQDKVIAAAHSQIGEDYGSKPRIPMLISVLFILIYYLFSRCVFSREENTFGV